MHREVSLYGDDPEVWRPERWMCGEEKKTVMYNALLTVSSSHHHHQRRHLVDPNLPMHLAHSSILQQFGAGHRSCLGKHLAYFEIYKLIPSLVQRYDVSGK